jgi:hypothetical protein
VPGAEKAMDAHSVPLVAEPWPGVPVRGLDKIPIGSAAPSHAYPLLWGYSHKA